MSDVELSHEPDVAPGDAEEHVSVRGAYSAMSSVLGWRSC